MGEEGEEHHVWLGEERGMNAADKALARRWGGDTKSLQASCSQPLQRTQVSPKSCPGAKASHTKEVLAGESQAHVASNEVPHEVQPRCRFLPVLPTLDQPRRDLQGLRHPEARRSLIQWGFLPCFCANASSGVGFLNGSGVLEIPWGDGDFGSH